MNSRLDKNKKVRKEVKKEEQTKKKLRRKKRSRKLLFVLIIILVLGLTYARFIEPNMLFVYEYKITSNTIGENFNGLKIVHFTDLHYGSTVKENQLNKIITEINDLKPDIVIFTGDLIEEDYQLKENENNILVDCLKKIKTKYGKYAVIGNHDYYNEDFHNIIYDSEFMLLNNSYDVIYSYNDETIGIYGFDNITYGNPDMNLLKTEAFLNLDYKIVLVHEPDYIDNFVSDTNIHLILSGHSHNQQVRIPFIKGFWLPEGAKNYYEPYYNVDDTDVYVSNGLGTSLLKLRFLNPPSINFFRIVKK